ncbi:GbsR/MarR family transcriptional regulator [Halostella litorea]|uniref:GbsR/MarR family transcriptional regulator n=1 Tax=Halostella litorea TaxID=2528831 RepID=UPI001093227B|nr:transcriptional regulator [Halostella litorea]
MSDTDDGGVEAARERVIAAMERSAEVYGFKRSYGRLYGLLFFAEEPRSLDDLVEESDYAKSTVSTAMSALERYHLVHRRSMPGEGKRAYFEAETDFWRVFQEFLRNEVLREVTVMSRALSEAEAELEAADTERAARDLEKVRRLRRMYDRSETMIDALTGSSFDRLTDLVGRLRRD